MPDTGAPWNIPYVESTDLVSDWPADSLALANAIDAGLDAAGNAGIGSNVVQTVKTNKFTTSSTSWTALTGMSVSITPSSASSKVLVIATVAMHSTANGRARMMRGATPVMVGSFGSTEDVTFYARAGANNEMFTPLTSVYLDSPASAASVTYSLEVQTDITSPLYVNTREVGDQYAMASSITAIEVAA